MKIINHRFSSSGVGAMLSESFNRLMWSSPQKYPFTDRGDTILAVGDFAGRHRRIGYQTYAFLIMDLERNRGWLESQLIFRRDILKDRRRLSFKDLNDKVRRRSLPAFLAMANEIEGWLVSFCLTREVMSIFRAEDRSEMPSEFKGIWKEKVAEEALRILHFSSFLLTGLSREKQNLLFIIDQDAIASNQGQLSKLTHAFGNVWSNYADHDLNHVRCGTTENDDGSLSLEDLAALPDLAAGAICEATSEMVAVGQLKINGLLMPVPKSISDKSKSIISWLSCSGSPLRRVTCVIDASNSMSKMTAKIIHWHEVSGISQ